MKAMTVRLKDDEYKKIMKYLIDNNIKSFQQYVLELINQDMNKKVENSNE